MDQAVGIDYQRSYVYENNGFNNLFSELAERVRADFYGFLSRLGLADEKGLLVIPYAHHYFFNSEDFEGIKTIVNLRQLNHVRDIRDFLRSISEALPSQSSFVGCFVDNKSQNGFSDKYSKLPGILSEKAEAYENGIESRIPFINRMYSFIDSKTNRYMTRRSVYHLLEECGLQITSMTEQNGITYFCSAKIRPAA